MWKMGFLQLKKICRAAATAMNFHGREASFWGMENSKVLLYVESIWFGFLYILLDCCTFCQEQCTLKGQPLLLTFSFSSCHTGWKLAVWGRTDCECVQNSSTVKVAMTALEATAAALDSSRSDCRAHCEHH
jgi:hypothetical protein